MSERRLVAVSADDLERAPSITVWKAWERGLTQDEADRLSRLLHDGPPVKFYEPEDVIAAGKLRAILNDEPFDPPDLSTKGHFCSKEPS